MPQKKVFVTKEMRKKKIGMQLGIVKEEVEQGWIRRFCQASDDPNPLYYDETFAKQNAYRGIIAPPTFFFALDPSQRGKYGQSSTSQFLKG